MFIYEICMYSYYIYINVLLLLLLLLINKYYYYYFIFNCILHVLNNFAVVKLSKKLKCTSAIMDVSRTFWRNFLTHGIGSDVPLDLKDDEFEFLLYVRLFLPLLISLLFF